MKEVTHLFANYGECMRHLWNMNFRTVLGDRTDWDFQDSFEDIAVAIFSSLVLYPLSICDQKLSPRYLALPTPLTEFCIVPNRTGGTAIMINREAPPCDYYDHPVSEVMPGEVDLRFVQYFDFDRWNSREYRYFEVSIQASAKYPEIVGRNALIEVGHATVVFTGPEKP